MAQPALTVTSAVDEYVIVAVCDDENSTNDTLTAGGSQTVINTDAVGAGLVSGASSDIAGAAGSVAVSYTGVGSTNTWGIVGVSLRGAASSPTYAPRSSLWHPGRHPRRFLGHNRALTWVNPPSVNTYTYAGSGGLQSGGAAPVQVLFIPRPTGGLQSGGTAPRLFVAIPKVSGGLQSGGIAPSSLTKSFVASGGLQSGGHAPMTFTAIPRPTGGLHSAGSAPMSAQLVHRPAGGLNAGGTAPRFFILTVRPSGGLNASGAASVVFVPGGQPQQTRSTTMWIGMGIRV